MLLSHRYGTICLPTRIIATEFEKLKNEVRHINEHVDLFEHIDLSFSYKYAERLIELHDIMEYCYELDENACPAIYRLKYLDRIFPTINHKVFDTI